MSNYSCKYKWGILLLYVIDFCIPFSNALIFIVFDDGSVVEGSLGDVGFWGWDFWDVKLVMSDYKILPYGPDPFIFVISSFFYLIRPRT